VRHDLFRRPFHVGAKRGPELGLFGQAGVIRRLHEAGDEPLPPVFRRARASVHFEHARVTAVQLRVPWRAAKHLGPVEGEVVYMRWIESMGEGMADLRFLEAALVMSGRQREEGGITAGE